MKPLNRGGTYLYVVKISGGWYKWNCPCWHPEDSHGQFFHLQEKGPFTMSNKTPPNKIGRDARTGQYIPVREAERRPSTTVVETRPKPPSNPKK